MYPSHQTQLSIFPLFFVFLSLTWYQSEDRKTLGFALRRRRPQAPPPCPATSPPSSTAALSCDATAISRRRPGCALLPSPCLRAACALPIKRSAVALPIKRPAVDLPAPYREADGVVSAIREALYRECHGQADIHV